MSSRTLNGVSGNSTNYSLIKFYNLSDLTDVSGARVNLGLVGSLNVASSPYLSISEPYNALSNQTITLNASNNATPNTLAAYDLSGNMRCGNFKNDTFIFRNSNNNVNISMDSSGNCYFKQIIGRISVNSNTYKPLNDSVITFRNYNDETTAVLDVYGNFEATASVGGPLVSASTSVRSPAYKALVEGNNISFTSFTNMELAHIKPTGEFVGTNQMTVNNSLGLCNLNLNCTATGGKNWKVFSTSSSNTGGAGNFQIYNQTNSIESIQIDGGNNSVRVVGTLLVDGGLSTSSGTNISFNNKNFTNVGAITSTSISTPSITSSGIDISFNLKNLTNVGAITSTSISTPSLTSSGEVISFNSKKLTNISNVSKQLWAFTNTIANTSSVISNIPINSQPVMNLTTSTLYTFRMSVPFTYNGESTLRLSYVRQIIGSSSGLFIVLGLYDYTYIEGPPVLYNSVLKASSQSVVYNNSNPTTDTVSIALGGIGLTIGRNYSVVLADKATTAGMQFYLYNPEISLLY